MDNNYNKEIKNQSHDEIDLKKLFLILWGKKYLIITLTLMSAFISVFIALNKPNIYKSTALVTVIESSTGGGISSNLSSQYGGLASLAGISLPSSGGADKTSLAIETIKSRSFFRYLIKENDILPMLMAAESYNPISKQLILDSEAYDSDLKLWLKDENGINYAPSFLESYDIYRSLLSITKDQETGYLNMSIINLSPVFAEYLLSLIIAEVNVLTREKDLNESDRAMKYLISLAAETSIAGVKNSINKLIESQLETQMLANINEDYLLQSLDPPFIPELKFAPVRSQIAIFGTITGCFLSIFLVLFYSMFFSSNQFIKFIKD